MATIRQQLFASLATPYLGHPPDGVELYRVGLTSGLGRRGIVVIGLTFAAFTLAGVWTAGLWFFAPGRILILVYALLTFALVRLYRAWHHAPNDVLVAVDESQIAVLRASAGLFRDWHVLNAVGMWPLDQVQITVAPETFALRITPPGGEPITLEPSPLTDDSIRLGRQLDAL